MAGCKNKRQTKGPTIKKATTYDISETNVKTGLICACNVSACTARNFGKSIDLNKVIRCEKE